MKSEWLFLSILRHFAHSEQPMPDVSHLSDEDWQQLIAFASEHALLPVLCAGVQDADQLEYIPDSERSEIKKATRYYVVRQMQAEALFIQLYQKLLAENIVPLVMKGAVCRQMYSHPDFRISGDEDILIRREDWKRLDTLLLREGLIREGDIDPETGHEITYHMMGNLLRIEVHLSLFPDTSDAYGHLNRLFPHVFEEKYKMTVQGGDIYTLDPTHHMLYLLCHGLKHFLHSGFGIRQLMDMVMFAETYGSEIDWNWIERTTKKENMYIFWMNLFDIGERYLAFSWEKAGLERPDADILHSDDMLADLMDSGIYGHSSAERMHSANMTLRAAAGEKGSGAGIRRSLFPDYDYMKRQYPFLEKKSWLIGYAWIHRLVTYLKSNGGKAAKKTADMGNQRVDLLKEYGIIDK